MARRKVIALFLNSAGLADDYQGELRSGAEREAVARGLDLWVYAGRTEWDVPESGGARIYDLVDPERLDGIVLAAGTIASYAPLADVVSRLRSASSVPLCSVGQYCHGVPNVLVNNVTAVAALVNHLVSAHSRKRFAYIAGPTGHEESSQRLDAARSALAQHGLELSAQLIVRGDLVAYSARKATTDVIARGLQFDALLAANDDMAVGAMQALRMSGIACPQDVSVAGFDDAAVARYCEPALTTVRQPVARLGATAVAQLASGLTGDDIKIIDTELMVRESCGCCPTHTLCPKTGERLSAIETAEDHRRALLQTLSPLIDDREARSHWVETLLRSVDEQCTGSGGSFLEEFGRLLESLKMLYVPPHELQRSVSILRSYAAARGGGSSVEDSFHAARVFVGALTYRSAGSQRLRSEYLLEELRLSSERLTTSLTMSALKEALVTELPRLGVGNALISLHPEQDRNLLSPLAYLRNGRHVELDTVTYPARQLVPNGAFDDPRRYSLTILPLTFEGEQLGVAVLELPLGLEVYSLLREQIGSAVRNVLLHQAILNRERFHAKSQEERRVTTERLRSMSLIAGGVAHDLNNILGPLVALPTTIQNDLLRSGSRVIPAEALQDLETIRIAGQRAAETIRDLTTFGTPSDESEVAIDVNQVLVGAERALRSLCGGTERITLEMRIAPYALTARVSKSSLLRAVTNLVVNATDAIADKGAIVVQVCAVTLSAPSLGEEPFEPGKYAIIQVTDDGIGIEPAVLKKIFEPFFTAKRSAESKGSGLGLSIVERIVKGSGGFIRVQSRVGEGTSFFLHFPLIEEISQSRCEPPRSFHGSGERLLVVDDEPVQLRTARRVLSQFGYAVVTANTGEEALKLFAESRNAWPFALVVVDMVMPGSLSGKDTIAELRKLNPGQKALIASGCAPDSLDADLGELGCKLVSKPYTPEMLVGAVRMVLDEDI